LLIGNIVVGGQKNIKPCSLGDAQKLTVRERIPSLLDGRSDSKGGLYSWDHVRRYPKVILGHTCVLEKKYHHATGMGQKAPMPDERRLSEQLQQ